MLEYAARDALASIARERESPSTGAHNQKLLVNQTLLRTDAIYNHRPIELSPPPITIYHPVFAEFIHLMNTETSLFTFTTEELKAASQFSAISAAFYHLKTMRQAALHPAECPRRHFWESVEVVLDPTTSPATVIKPDGLISADCYHLPPGTTARVSFNEIKNGAGEGGSDASDQAVLAWQRQVSAIDVSRFVSSIEPLTLG